MNTAYFIMRSEGLGHEMYYCWGTAGTTGKHWTFDITEANHWPTESRPALLAAAENSTEVSVVEMTKQEYFKRVLQGK